MPKENNTALLLIGALVLVILFLSKGMLFSTIPSTFSVGDERTGNASAMKFSWSQNRSLTFVTDTAGSYNISMNAWQQQYGADAQLQVYLDGTQMVSNLNIPSVDNNNPNVVAFASTLTAGNHTLVLGFYNDGYNSGTYNVTTSNAIYAYALPTLSSPTAWSWLGGAANDNGNLSTSTSANCSSVGTDATMQSSFATGAYNSVGYNVTMTMTYLLPSTEALQVSFLNPTTGTYVNCPIVPPALTVPAQYSCTVPYASVVDTASGFGKVQLKETATCGTTSTNAITIFDQNIRYTLRTQLTPILDRNLLVSDIQYNLIPVATQTTNTTSTSSCKVLTCASGYQWLAPCSCVAVCPTFSNDTSGLQCDVITGGTDWQGCALPPRCSEYLPNMTTTLPSQTTTSTTGSIVGGFTMSDLLFNPIAVVSAIGIILFFAGAFKKKR